MQDAKLHDKVENKHTGQGLRHANTSSQDGRFQEKWVGCGVKCDDPREDGLEEEYEQQTGPRLGVHRRPQEDACQEEEYETCQLQHHSEHALFTENCELSQESRPGSDRSSSQSKQIRPQNEEKSEHQERYGVRGNSSGQDVERQENQMSGKYYLGPTNEMDEFPFKNDDVLVAVCDELEESDEDFGDAPFSSKRRKSKVLALSCLVPLLAKYCMPKNFGKELEDDRQILKRIDRIENRLESVSQRIDNLIKSGRLCKKHTSKNFENQSSKVEKRAVMCPKDKEELHKKAREKPARRAAAKSDDSYAPLDGEWSCGIPFADELSCDIPFDDELSEDESNYCGKGGYESESNFDESYRGRTSEDTTYEDETSFEGRPCAGLTSEEDSCSRSRATDSTYSRNRVCEDTSYSVDTDSKDECVKKSKCREEDDSAEDNPIQKCIKRITSFGSEMMESLRNSTFEQDEDEVDDVCDYDAKSDEPSVRSCMQDFPQKINTCEKSLNETDTTEGAVTTSATNSETSAANSETSADQTKECVAANPEVREEETKSVAYANEYQPYLIKKPDGMPRSLQRKLAALTGVNTQQKNSG